MSSTTQASPIVWAWREGITEFVINGYTRERLPVVHTPQCHHVKDRLLDVIQRYPKTGNKAMRVDLLEVLWNDPNEPTDWCRHCVIRKG